jgi:hypothetical protein
MSPGVGRASFVVGVFLLATLTAAPPAMAHPSESCATGVYKHDIEGNDPDQDGYQIGMRGNVHVAAPKSDGSDCMRVSSIAMADSDGSVEIGWVIGWLPSANNVYTGTDACDDQYNASPELFVVWQPIGGGYHCRQLAYISQSTDKQMTVADSNGNTIFNYWYDGFNYGSANVNFSDSRDLTNSERHASTDGMYADFNNLQNQLYNEGFQSYAQSALFYSNDSDHVWVKDSADHTEVEVSSTCTGYCS